MRKRIEEDKENSLSSSSNPSPPALSNELLPLLAAMPELPEPLLAAATDQARFAAMCDWITTNDLRTRWGPDFIRGASAVAGLVAMSVGKRSPRGYLATCLRNGVAEHVVQSGRDWMRRMQRKQAAVVR